MGLKAANVLKDLGFSRLVFPSHSEVLVNQSILHKASLPRTSISDLMLEQAQTGLPPIMAGEWSIFGMPIWHVITLKHRAGAVYTGCFCLKNAHKEEILSVSG